AQTQQVRVRWQGQSQNSGESQCGCRSAKQREVITVDIGWLRCRGRRRSRGRSWRLPRTRIERSPWRAGRGGRCGPAGGSGGRGAGNRGRRLRRGRSNRRWVTGGAWVPPCVLVRSSSMMTRRPFCNPNRRKSRGQVQEFRDAVEVGGGEDPRALRGQKR